MIRRRSTSSWVSPGPLVPIPPACWDKVSPLPRRRGQPVTAEGELDLCPALLGVGVLGEDVEDHRRPVDGGPSEDLLEVPLLGGCQLVVEDDRVGIDGLADPAQLFRLAPADVGGGIDRVTPLHDPGCLVGSGGVDEQGELVEARLDLLQGARPGHHADEHDLLPEPPVDKGGPDHRHDAATSSDSASSAGSSSKRATRWTGPASSAESASGSSPERVTSATPPGLWTRTLRRRDPRRMERRRRRHAAGPASERHAGAALPYDEGQLAPVGLIGGELNVLAPGTPPFQCRAHGGEGDALQAGRQQDQMRVPDLDGPSRPRQRPRTRQGRVGDGVRSGDFDLAHVDRHLGAARAKALAQTGPSCAGVGLYDHVRAWHEPGLDGGKAEAAQAVSTRLGPAPVGVAQHHAYVPAGIRSPQHEEAVGSHSGVPSAKRPRKRAEPVVARRR